MTEQIAEQEYAADIETVIKRKRRLIEGLKELRPSLYPRHLLTEALECEECRAWLIETVAKLLRLKEPWHIMAPGDLENGERGLQFARLGDLVMGYCPRHGVQILNAIYWIWNTQDFGKDLAESEELLPPSEQESQMEIGNKLLENPWDKEILANLTTTLRDALLSTGYYEQFKGTIRPTLNRFEGTVRVYGNDMTMREAVREGVLRTSDAYRVGRLSEKPEGKQRLPNADITPHATLLCSECKGNGCGRCRGTGVIQQPPLMKKTHPEFDRFVKETSPLYTKRLTKSQRERHVDTKLHSDAKRDKTTTVPGSVRSSYPKSGAVGAKPTSGWKGVNWLNPRKRTRKGLKTLNPTELIEARRAWRREYMRDYRKGLRRSKPPSQM